MKARFVTYDVDLGVGVTHVAENAAGLHLVHGVAGDDVLVAGARDDDVGLTHHLVELDDAEPLHAANKQHASRQTLSDRNHQHTSRQTLSDRNHPHASRQIRTY